MVSISIDSGDFEDLMQRLPTAAQNQGTLHNIIDHSRLIVQSHVMKDAPVKTGNLRRSITSHMTGPVSGVVGANAKYAAAVELGARPHEIFPSFAAALKFVPKSLASYGPGGTVRLTGRARTAGGQPVDVAVFRQSVHHPGTRAHEFMRQGFQESMPQIQATIQNAARTIVEGTQ